MESPILPISERWLPYEVVRVTAAETEARLQAEEEARRRRLANPIQYPEAKISTGAERSSFIIKFVPATSPPPRIYSEPINPVIKMKGGYQVSKKEEIVYEGPPIKIHGALPEPGEIKETPPLLPPGTDLTRVRVTPEEVQASMLARAEARRLASLVQYPKARVHGF
jgi:hypothetical protein